MDIKQLSNILQDMGVVGAGGAGFPTYGKLDSRAETIILNCAECEPLLRLHRQMLDQYAYEILKTFHLIARTLGAKKAVVGVKKAYKDTVESVKTYIEQYPEMELGLLNEVYPAGDEVVLIYEVTGKVIPPGGLPIQSGVAVFNVETIYNVYQAVENQMPVTEKYISVVGEVAHPSTFRVPIGITIEEVVKAAGGAMIDDPVCFMGGPMMGNIVNMKQPITKTSNALIILPQDHLIIQRKKQNTSIDLKRAAASCCQCSMCTDLCPRNLLGHPVEPHKFMQAATCKDVQKPEIFLNTMFCCSCGLCELYSCMQGLSPRTLMTEYKNGLRKAGVAIPKDVEVKPVHPARPYRKSPMKRLMSRLDLVKYDKEAPMSDRTFEPLRVKINLSQHIGAPASLAVKVGDKVTKGQIVAEPAKGLSVAIHASITGRVIEANDQFIMIKRD